MCLLRFISVSTQPLLRLDLIFTGGGEDISHASLRRFVPGAADVQRKRQLQQMTAAQELAAMRTALRVGRGVRGAMPNEGLAKHDLLLMPVSGHKLLESAALSVTLHLQNMLPCFL